MSCEKYYPFQGSAFDLPTIDVIEMEEEQRATYVDGLLAACKKAERTGEFWLGLKVSYKSELADLRRIISLPASEYLHRDEITGKRNVLAVGAPGRSHITHSLKNMWRMMTKIAWLEDQLRRDCPRLRRKFLRLFDSEVSSKKSLRGNGDRSAILTAFKYLKMDTGTGCAFPPFHARFFADEFLPPRGEVIVVDPCIGWGGRLLGVSLVDRKIVRFVGTDPETRNHAPYEMIKERVTVDLAEELAGPRHFDLHDEPFEDWIETPSARTLRNRVDLVMTSPPYFNTENYNVDNKRQSANRYLTYPTWKSGFYKPLISGSYTLLKTKGKFVLNVADVEGANTLEKDAKTLAERAGFDWVDEYKLALPLSPAARKHETARREVIVDGKRFKYEPVFVFNKPREDSLYNATWSMGSMPLALSSEEAKLIVLSALLSLRL